MSFDPRLPWISGLILALLATPSLAQTSGGSHSLPTPSSTIDGARERLRETLGEVLEVEDLEQGRRLVGDLRQKANRAQPGEPVHFVLLEEALRVARRCHDGPLLLECFEDLLREYDLALAPAHVRAFDEYDPRDDGSVSGVRIAERCFRLADSTARAEDFEGARDLLKIVGNVERVIGSGDLRARVKSMEKQHREWKKLAERGRRALSSLEQEVTPRASLDAARYLLELREDWEGAAPHLMRSTNVSLVETLASDSQLGGPTGGEVTPEIALDLARAWRKLAERESSAPLREAFYRRARDWYFAALEETADVLEHDALQLERDEILTEFGAPEIYLASLRESEVHAPLGELGKDGWMGLDQDEVQVGGRLRLHSLALHAGQAGDDAKIRYDLGRAWSSLRGSVALNDTSAQTFTAPLVFHLIGDGKSLWSSKPITTVAHTQEFLVKVKGVKSLELVIECGGLNRSAHSIWVDPVLLR